jgi:dihydrofolate synthase/folylpolyglutamate synthase
MRLLGNSLLEIAHQKCGIIKPHVPIVVGHINEQEVIDVINCEAYEKKAPIILSDETYNQLPLNERIPYRNFHNWNIEPLYYNLQTVSCALHVLRKKWAINLSPQELRDVVEYFAQTTGFYGRWQICSESPTVIADVADNPQALQLNFEQLQKIYKTERYQRLVLILGITGKEKLSVQDFIPRNALYIITESKGFLTPLQIAEGLGVQGYISTDVNDAMNYYYSIARADDLVYIGGSIHIVHDALLFLGIYPNNRNKTTCI